VRAALKLVILFAALGIFLGRPSTSSACSCLTQNLCTELSYTDFVFAGRVISITPDPNETFRLVRMVVLDQYKGTLPDTVEVITGWWDGDCGVPFYLAPEWLVFGTPEFGGRYGSHLCSRTRPYDPNDPILSEIVEPCFTPAVPVSWGRIKSLRIR
jgi:hypothetical protein